MPSVPRTLSELGVPESAAEALTIKALKDAAAGTNPRVADADSLMGVISEEPGLPDYRKLGECVRIDLHALINVRMHAYTSTDRDILVRVCVYVFESLLLVDSTALISRPQKVTAKQVREMVHVGHGTLFPSFQLVSN